MNSDGLLGRSHFKRRQRLLAGTSIFAVQVSGV